LQKHETPEVMRSKITVKKETLIKICNHAIAEYPDECCGIVTGRGDNQRVHFCKNLQNLLHLEDPERYPRDARTSYFIDRKEAEAVFSDANRNGEGVIAFYHSHTDNPAFFSDIDKEAQTVFGEPEFPDAIHIVVSVIKREIKDIRYFVWDREERDFIEIRNPVNVKTCR